MGQYFKKTIKGKFALRGNIQNIDPYKQNRSDIVELSFIKI